MRHRRKPDRLGALLAQVVEALIVWHQARADRRAERREYLRLKAIVTMTEAEYLRLIFPGRKP